MGKQRGVVMIPHFEVRGTKVTHRGNAFSPALLRRSAIYWDKVDVPRNQVIDAPIAMTPEVRELMGAGVLSETLVQVGIQGPIPMGDIILGTQWALFEAHERQEPGCWAIAQDASELVASIPHSEKAVTAEVELHNLLPVPSDDVPIAAVLEFKQRRQAELERLRDELDSLCEQIGTAQNVPRVRNAAIDRVQTAVSDVFRTMNESFTTRLARRVEISSISLGTVVAVGAAIANIPFAPLVGVLASEINFRIKEARAPKNLVRSGPFAYVHDLMKEISTPAGT